MTEQRELCNKREALLLKTRRNFACLIGSKLPEHLVNLSGRRNCQHQKGTNMHEKQTALVVNSVRGVITWSVKHDSALHFPGSPTGSSQRWLHPKGPETLSSVLP